MPDIFIADDKDESPQLPRGAPSIEKLESTKPDKKHPLLPELHHAKHKMFPLASFALDPDGVSFATQGENEEIHLFLRRHFVTNIPWIFLSVILFLAPLFAVGFLRSLPFISDFTPAMSFILLAFYYVVVFGAVVLASFMNWYFNVYIVTNERVLDVDFINILYREVSATRLNLIQDVTSKTGGVIKAIFNYGDVFIQTAGAEVNFDFHAVPRPQEVSREIEKLMGKARTKEGVSDIEEQIEK